MSIDYWRECIKISAEECGAALTDEQAADELEQARAHITELEQTLDLRHKADMRAIERWRAEKPDERED